MRTKGDLRIKVLEQVLTNFNVSSNFNFSVKNLNQMGCYNAAFIRKFLVHNNYMTKRGVKLKNIDISDINKVRIDINKFRYPFSTYPDLKSLDILKMVLNDFNLNLRFRYNTLDLRELRCYSANHLINYLIGRNYMDKNYTLLKLIKTSNMRDVANDMSKYIDEKKCLNKNTIIEDCINNSTCLHSKQEEHITWVKQLLKKIRIWK